MKAPARTRLTVEHLEARDVPSTAPLPGGWNQWSNDGSTAFADSAGVGNSLGIISTGASSTTALAWETQTEPGDTAVSAQIDLTSLVPTFVFANGANLGTSAPSYLAAVVTRGVSVSLVQVTNGTATVLESMTSPSSAYFSGNWAEVSLIPNGSTVGVQVVRQDTGQYLNAKGTWQSAPTDALSATASLAQSAGDVGVGRFASYAGAVAIDDFSIPPPASPPPPPPAAAAVSQSFDATAAGATPSGWQDWFSNSLGSAGISSALALSPPNSYAFTGASNTSALAWATSTLPSAVSASAAVYVNSLIPAQVFVAGANLNSTTPTYDAVTITRGVSVSLVQVIDGKTTTLAGVNSAGYLSGAWVDVEITVQGSTVEATIERTDTGQWLTSSGAWSSSPAIALSATDAASLPAGFAGVGRAASYAGTIYFDNFSAGAAGTLASPPVATSPPPIAVDADPIAATGYAPVTATDTLFGPNGPSYLDVDQGYDGDCWLIASLAEVADQAPQDIVNMFKYDGTTVENGATVGVYTIRFYNSNNVPEYVTVDTELPGGGDYYDQPVNGVLWVALAEKAYAVANGLGDVSSSEPGASSYAALNSGYSSQALQAITGITTSTVAINPGQIASAWTAGDFIVLSTVTPSSAEIVADHSYAVVGYSAATGLFTLLNPWGGTTSSTACPQEPDVYGLFTANAAFVTANFTVQTTATNLAAPFSSTTSAQNATGSAPGSVGILSAGNGAGPTASEPGQTTNGLQALDTSALPLPARHHASNIDTATWLGASSSDEDLDWMGGVYVDE